MHFRNVHVLQQNDGTDACGAGAAEGFVLLPSSPKFIKDDCMKIKRQIIVFDAPDLAAESTFWAGLLGGTVVAEDDWHSVLVDGEWRLGVQLAPNHVPPDWPDGTPQQMHLDLHVDDLKAAHEEAISLGARLLKPADDLAAAEAFQVYADPAGHPFCLGRH
jgi:catechol 2,3-dioxygenase-like lactoylglutathione lyase family enzyme